MQPSQTSPAGRLLREWRAARGMSQLDLAHAAGTTPRHVSFVETGRANPSPAMLHRLANVLDMPLRDRNGLLQAAGYAPAFAESRLDAAAMAQVKRALDFLLRAHMPYPALVLNKVWDLVAANPSGERLLSRLGGGADDRTATPNLLRQFLAPGPQREMVVDWPNMARSMLRRLRNELLHRPDEDRRRLLEEVSAYPGVPASWATGDEPDPLPVLTIAFEVNGRRSTWFSTVTTLGTPQDVTLQELSIESFFPADDATETAVRELVAG